MSRLRPGGQLAVQIPCNQGEPVWQVLRAVTTSPDWAPKFSAVPERVAILSPGGYYDLLAGLTPDFSIWITTYFHTMRSPVDILEWYRGTGLRPFLEALPEADRPAFEQELLDGFSTAYPPQKNGVIIFPFPRLFFTARK